MAGLDGRDGAAALREPLLLPLEEVEETDSGRPISVIVGDDDEGGDAETGEVDGDGGASATATTEDKPSVTSRALLIAVALLYATFTICLRGVYSLPDPPTPSEWTAVRGWASLASFLPLAMMTMGTGTRGNRRCRSSSSSSSQQQQRQETPPAAAGNLSLCAAAAELALWNFLSQASYNVGLLTTTAARAAFLSQTCVIMTPLIALAVGDRVGGPVWLGCLASLVGLGLLSSPVGGGASPHGAGDDDGPDAAPASSPASVAAAHVGLGTGDCLVLFAAVCWSFYILRTSKFGGRFGGVHLQGVKNLFLAVLYTLWWSVDRAGGGGGGGAPSSTTAWWTNPSVLLILAYSAVFPGTVADLLQQRAQASVPASESTVLLSTEPVFTAALAFLLLGERLSWQESLGGCFLVLGTAVSSL